MYVRVKPIIFLRKRKYVFTKIEYMNLKTIFKMLITLKKVFLQIILNYF